LTEWKN